MNDMLRQQYEDSRSNRTFMELKLRSMRAIIATAMF